MKTVKQNMVQQSADYDLLTPNPENRNIKESQVHKLMNLIKQSKGFLKEEAIICDENLVIIKGHHRFEAAKRLAVPYYYICIEGATMANARLAEMAGNTSWNIVDWATSHVNSSSNKHYQVFLEFVKEFNLPHAQCITILVGKVTRDFKLEKDFQRGLFKVVNKERAFEVARLICSLRPLYSGYGRRNFIFAMLNCLNNPLFQWERFMRKLRYLHLRDETTTDAYLAQIESIYNFRESNKLPLRIGYTNAPAKTR